MSKNPPPGKKRFSFVALKQSIQLKIDQIEKRPKSVKRDIAIAKLKAMKKLAPCPPQIMVGDI